MSFDPETHRALSKQGAIAGHAKKRGHSHKVANLVTLLGTATVDDLSPLLPLLTRRQILDALRNARAAKLLRVVARGARVPRGFGSGSGPSTWGPWVDGDEDEDDDLKPKPVDMATWVRPVSFVFDLGTRATQGATV